jgi:hypothetical protein
MSPIVKRLCIAMLILAILSPLGLLLPARLGAGSAWGEWSSDEVKGLVGYLPAGLARLGELWKAPLPDYAMPGQEEAPLRALSLSYILSALVGGAAVAGVTLLIGRSLARREQPPDAS